MHVHLVGDRPEHVQVGADARHAERRGERAAAAFPVDERAGLLRDRRDREDHVGAVGDRAGPQLEGDDERRPLKRAQRAGRVRQVRRVDASDDQRAEFAVFRGA